MNSKTIKPFFLFVLFPVLAFADILTLIDQSAFQGKVTKIKDCAIIFKTNDDKYLIPAHDIFSIEFEDPNDKIYTDFLKLSDQDPDKCLNGRLDAENFHGKRGGHFILGVLFGPFAMIGTAIANPTPDRGKQTYMLSKNKDLFTDPEYLNCYRKKAKGQLIGMEALGWGALILLVLLFGA